VEMVTTNPAKTLRWTQELGSIEPGKFADLLLITKHSHPSAEGLPNSPYRNLIDATEQDVRLVIVNGEPLCGDVDIMEKLKPGDYEVIRSVAGCFSKAIDVTIDVLSQRYAFNFHRSSFKMIISISTCSGAKSQP